jgi:anti-sigma28 factor (negative regulator of flagellin synthesis)
MINDIKLDAITPVTTPKKSQPAGTQACASTIAPEVTISAGFSKHINALLADHEPANDNARVLEMKSRIQSNNYTIDTDRLAKKIFQDIFTKNI